MTFGETIRQLRHKKEWSVSDLATRVAKSTPYVSRIETRGEIPSPSIILKLAEILGIRAERLFDAAKKEKSEELIKVTEKKYDDALALYRKGQRGRK